MIQKSRTAICNHFNKFPAKIRVFLFRILVMFLVWKFIYGFFLEPQRIMDNPLTMRVGSDVAWVLTKMTSNNNFKAAARISDRWFEGKRYLTPVTRIEYKGQKLMHIADSCNGLELFVLYIGFIFAIPASLKRKLAFAIGGIAIIYIVNVLRCVGLAFVAINWRDQFDFAHHYFFKVIVYSIVFLLWVKFADKTLKEPVPQTSI